MEQLGYNVSDVGIMLVGFGIAWALCLIGWVVRKSLGVAAGYDPDAEDGV